MSVSTIDFSAGGYGCRILLPDTYTDKAVIYHHGAGESGNGITTAGDSNIDRCCTDGYLVAGSAAANDNWGNQAGLDAYVALQSYIVTNYAPAKTAIYSKSMGGLTGLLTVASGAIVGLKGWFGVYPVCNLSNMFASNTGTYAPDIRAAYGIASDGSDYGSKTSGHDPLLVSASSFSGKRYRFYASSADTVVTKTNNSDAFSAYITAIVPEATVIACTGNHGDPSHYQPADVSSFLSRVFGSSAGHFGTSFAGVVR